MDKQKLLSRLRIDLKYFVLIAVFAFIIQSFISIMDFKYLTDPHRLRSLVRLLQPWTDLNFSDLEIRQIVIAKAWETINMGFLATTIGAIFALPFTYLSARPTSNWGQGFNIILQPFLSVVRSIHPLYVSLIFIMLAGIGPTTGVLSLTIFSTALLIGKYSDYAQEHETTSWPVLFKVYFPGLAFRQLPVNILIGTILGFVGSGGIGGFLQTNINLLNYNTVDMVIIACVIAIGGADLISRAVWSKVTKSTEDQGKTAKSKTVIYVVLWLVFGALFIFSFSTFMDFEWISDHNRSTLLMRILTALAEPQFRDAKSRQIVAEKVLETVQMGLLATTIGALLAFPFTYLSARPTSNWRRGVKVVLQPILSAIRSVHPLVSSVFFVVWAGIGPTTGVLALTIFTTAVLIVIFSEFAQQHASLSWPVLFKTYFPGLAFRLLPVNFVIGTIIGLAGAGGIGFILQQDIALLMYREASAILIEIIIVIGSIDLISRAVWRRIIKSAM